MIKSLTASLFCAAAFAQVPPGLQTTPVIVPEVPAVPAVPDTTNAPLTTNAITTAVTTAPVTTAAQTTAAITTAAQTTAAQTTAAQTTAATTVAPIVEPPTTLVPLLPPGDYWGSYGQICSPNPLTEAVCTAQGQLATSQVPGFTKCERNYDCCLCQTVSCGSEFVGCNTFSAGDSGVKGVKDIQIFGRLPQNGGAEVLCLGVEGCADAQFKATNVKQVKASGVMAMRNAVMTLVNPVPDFQLDCAETGACENLVLEIVIEGPPEGYQCNPAYDPITVEFNAIQCSKEESCANMQLTIRNEGCNPIEIQAIECIMPTSCAGAVFNLIGDIEINSCEIRGQPPAGLEMCYQGQGQGNPWAGNPGYNPYWVPI